jgi:hypothetical protein
MQSRVTRVLYALTAAALVAGGASVVAKPAPQALAPDPAVVREAVVQVYGARTLGVKGLFGVHTWIAAKPTDAREWTVYEVIGWRMRWSQPVVVVRNRAPDAPWFGSEPELYADKRGAGVDELIARIEAVVKAYPYSNSYTLWPGPNSNTFTAWIARAVPELEVDLPATAIGKDFIGNAILSSAPSGSGVQFSLAGLLGFSASPIEGLELNILGLNFGVSPTGVKLPLVGRIGAPHFASSALTAQAIPAPEAAKP